MPSETGFEIVQQRKKGIGAGRARLVVLGIEIGGRWSEETVTFIRLLANNKASSTPPSLRRSAALAWTSCWTALLATAVFRVQSLHAARLGLDQHGWSSPRPR